MYGTGLIARVTAGDYWTVMFMWGNGAELYNADETRVTLCVPEAYAALQMLVDLQREGVLVPTPDRHDFNTLLDMFAAKRLGLLNSSPPRPELGYRLVYAVDQLARMVHAREAGRSVERGHSTARDARNVLEVLLGALQSQARGMVPVPLPLPR